MCHRLAGSESGLLAYYRLDEAPGSKTIANSATATAGLFQGTATTAAPEFVISGAPVGDSSVNLYTNTWSGQSLQMTTANRGIFTIDSFGTTGSYLHLYRINAVPDSTRGLTAYADNNVSFGTFASGDTFVYYPGYDYNNYPNAVTYQAATVFFNRGYNDEVPWTYKGYTNKNTATHVARLDSVRGARQFFLANMTTGCSGAPSALTATNILPGSAQLGWSSSAVLWSIQYGPGGFVLGSGTVVPAVSSNPYTLTKLQPNTTYSYYVKDTCLFAGSSSWVGPYTFTTAPSYANFASGYAMQCDNTSPQGFNLGKVINDSLDKNDFTIEMWVKADPASTAGNPPLIANKNYASGANIGLALTYSASSSGPGSSQIPGSFRFNFKTDQGTTGSSGRHDYDIKPVNPHAWNHIAMTVNRRGVIKGYVNGVYQPNMYAGGAGTGVGNPDISADSARSLATGTLDLYLAQDGTGNYSNGYFFKGAMDEVRIWKRALDSNEIRKNMCQKLTGNEAGLLAYYPLNEVPGSTGIVNSAVATTGQFDGTATATPPSFVISGAPVGDTSVFLYTGNWSGKSLQLSQTGRGTFSVDSFSATGTYLHLYRVNGVPNFTTGLTAYSSNNVQFGVFDGADSFRYFPGYNYGSFDSAVSYRRSIHFFTRGANSDIAWGGKLSLYNDTLSNLLRTDSIAGTRQFFLANFKRNCDMPSALNAANITGTTAQLNWTTGGSGFWNIQYDTSGFALGTGTIISVTTNPYTLRGLQGRKSYDVYIQDSCVGIGSSSWAGPVTFTTGPDYAGTGSGYALRFQGNGVTNGPSYGVNLGTALRDSLAYTNFTIEMWVKIGAPNTNNPSLIANKDYINGGNPGISWNYAAPGNTYGSAPGHNFRFNITAQGGTRHDYDVPAANEYAWNHVAITVDRRGKIKGYLNGVYYPNKLTGSTASDNMSADSLRSLATGALPLYLGTDGTGNYRSPFNGTMDEVRIWKRVLDSSEIRSAMCHKLQGNEQGLLAYYRMDEETGTTVHNDAAATAGQFNGTFTANQPVHVVSGAPIGDTSVFIYPASGWNGVSLSMNSNGQGMLTVDSVTGVTVPGGIAVPGVHIYRINKAPNYAEGITEMGATDRFFGVFAADNVSAYYRAQYDYSSYPAAMANAANLHLYNRPHNASTRWAQLPATSSANVIGRTGFLGTRQYLLADFSIVPSCAAPANISLDSVTSTIAGLSWTSAAPRHISKYGLAGFDLDTAAARILTVNNDHLSSLVPNTYYDFYVQDSCGTGNNSAWVGPYTFATQGECVTPLNVHAENITTNSLELVWTELGQVVSNYGIGWGEQGSFNNPDSATYLPAFASRLLFDKLTPNTAYTFYIKTFCNSALTPTTGWVGPFTFTTEDTVSESISARNADAGRKLSIYPNPAADMLSVDLLGNNAAGVASLALYNNLGVLLDTKVIWAGEVHVAFNTSGLPDGVYHIQFLLKDKQRLYKAVIVKH